MKSRYVRISLPEPLAARIDAQRGEDDVQDFILAALRDKVYGSPVEAQLRAEVDRLHQTLRAFGGGSQPQPRPGGQAPATLLDALLEQPVAPRDEPQAQKKLGWSGMQSTT